MDPSLLLFVPLDPQGPCSPTVAHSVVRDAGCIYSCNAAHWSVNQEQNTDIILLTPEKLKFYLYHTPPSDANLGIGKPIISLIPQNVHKLYVYLPSFVSQLWFHNIPIFDMKNES